MTLDDHEVVDNWADEAHPSAPPAQFLVRRANAFRAYWEHMPLRLAQLPKGPDMQLYRRFQYGRLAEFSVLDTRQYRSDQAYGDGTKAPGPETKDPTRTITGDAQEKWLLDGWSASRSRWNVLAHQTAIARLDTKDGPDVLVPMDTWDGYEASRDRVLGGAAQRKVRNLVSIAGDLHRSVASDLKLDFTDPDSPTVGSEFVGTSISSGLDGMDLDPGGQTLLEREPAHQVRQLPARLRQLQHHAAAVDLRLPGGRQGHRSQNGTVSTRAKLLVEDGRPGSDSLRCSDDDPLAVGASASVPRWRQPWSPPVQCPRQPDSHTADRSSQVSVEPQQLSVVGLPCFPGNLTLTMTNTGREDRYADLTLDPSGPLHAVPRTVLVLAAGGRPRPAGVRAGRGPGAARRQARQYRIDLEVDRTKLTVPVQVNPLPSKDPGSNLALGEQAAASSTHGNFALCGAVDGDKRLRALGHPDRLERRHPRGLPGQLRRRSGRADHDRPGRALHARLGPVPGRDQRPARLGRPGPHRHRRLADRRPGPRQHRSAT